MIAGIVAGMLAQTRLDMMEEAETGGSRDGRKQRREETETALNCRLQNS
jgi:hypothetical protein